MNIALIGYGKMGHAIERMALERRHSVVCTIDLGEEGKFDTPEFASADVVIEFSRPDAALYNYRAALAHGKRIVSGTTGWTSHIAEVREMLERYDGTLLWTSNFSIGVNLFMAINAYAAGLMERFGQYAPTLGEIHHNHKLDHPSGTAITLANQIIEANGRIVKWEETEKGRINAGDILPVWHERIGEVPGTHIVEWKSTVDKIELKHEAFSRDGFALGAVVAAEWLVANTSRIGLVDFNEVLEIQK